MKHKCTVCGHVYEEDADILNGCLCGNKLFYFLSNKKKNKPEQFFEIEDEENNELIILDTESINIVANGKYEIDIQSLMNKDALVYKYADGKYSIDINNIDVSRKKCR